MGKKGISRGQKVSFSAITSQKGGRAAGAIGVLKSEVTGVGKEKKLVYCSPTPHGLKKPGWEKISARC